MCFLALETKKPRKAGGFSDKHQSFLLPIETGILVWAGLIRPNFNMIALLLLLKSLVELLIIPFAEQIKDEDYYQFYIRELIAVAAAIYAEP